MHERSSPHPRKNEPPSFWAPPLEFLRYAAWLILLAALGGLAAIVLLIPEQPLRACGPATMATVALLALRLFSVGRLHAALSVFVWGSWVTITGTGLLFGGAHAPLTASYPLLILMGGWLLGTRVAVVLAAATMSAIAGFALSDALKLLPTPPTPDALHSVVHLANAAVALLLIIFLIRTYQGRLEEVRRLSRDLEQRSVELQVREASLNRAQEVAHVGSWVLDLASGRVELSAEACRIYGFGSGTARDLHEFMQRIHPDDRRALEHASAAALRGEALDIEVRIVIGDTTRWVAQRAEVEFDEAGRPLRSVGTTQDITARKMLESSLREQKEFFRLISESIGEHIAVLDLEGRRLYNSPSYRQFFGDERQLTGSNSFADVHPEDRERVQAVFRQTVENGVGQAIEYRLLRHDGSVSHIASAGKVITNKEGRPARIVIVSHDVTQRKQAEQWERIAATAFESQQGMFITSADGVILRINQAFTDITGYSAEECLGRSPSLLRSGRHDEAFYAAMRESLAQSGAWQGEIWNRRRNGEIYPEWLTISSVRDAEGNVTHYVCTLADITAHKKAQEEIQQLAFYDALTGLPNRRLLHERLRLALSASKRNRQQGALLFIDLDNFKTLNDTLGHDMGDRLLQEVARRLLACVRERDTVARLGGDEFVVMLENLGERIDDAAAQCRTIGEKILAVLNRSYDLVGYEYHNTPSIGVALFGGARVSTDDLMKRADLAMYEAKAGGRNTLRFFDPQMQAVVTARVALEKDLREALERQSFFLAYQPQVDDRGRVIGAEALVRWQHAKRGMISPSEFIPLAEETGLILPLGLWVLETACAQAAVWAALPGREQFTVSVNVSARQFRQPNFVDQVLAVLAASATSPCNLKLELTESLLLDNMQDAIGKMAALKKRGVGFSLDDFGTGYSSLSYLKRLPFDQLKIDQSFVRDLLTDANDKVIADTIIALAHSLGLAVIAEGVESDEQRDALAARGCNAYQGYLFSRPLQVADFNRFLQQHSADPPGPTVQPD
ncbi:MAG TPA: EAL domain-containing protein [Accumulibacter sp.]|uniref:sensor domain-containing protein n=2 Tax=Accumulibacter sp. TaxID=2053492 RepID=UPI002BFEE3B2|nr:EAL domain-containing protein [Accumulibacter sp.]HMW81684.1 EAL domain-containing protein [Accumulibacter sp.]HNB69100.1 EAL domain-containing protein [Accumulibacter sp.]HNM65644.1 EAL domain-containing protein [Accumulibacter sp.]HNN83963.1 EAL domain-containing protein [Accumulibacter sp.]